MRLIDADRLKAAIHTDFSEHFTLYHDTDQTALFDMMMDDIDEIPTAFDKEKVISEMKKNSHNFYPSIDHYCLAQKAVDLKNAIEIVEKGGIEEKLMKVWITKYALTKGIIETEGEVSDDFPDILDAKGIVNYLHGEGKEWHMTKESAVQKAEEMRQKKIASLKKQIDKLERMRFE